jgi:hypothetical protein
LPSTGPQQSLGNVAAAGVARAKNEDRWLHGKDRKEYSFRCR